MLKRLKPRFRATPTRGASRPQSRLRRRLGWPLLALPLGLLVLLLALTQITLLTRQVVTATPIREVKISGDMRFIDERQVEALIRPHLARGFFLLELQHLRRELQALPWIQEVAVQRRWPDRLEILITEQVPVLRWGDSALLNPLGQAFRPSSMHDFEALPVLQGPAGSEALMLKRFDALMERLAGQGASVRSLQLDGKHSWSLELDNGLRVILGRRELERRSERLLAVLSRREALGELSGRQLDLRYSNGFTITPGNALAGVHGADHSSGESG